jgi:uncharacterized membrane protein
MFGIPVHQLIIHFPIALTVMVVVYDGWAVYSKRHQLHATTYGLSLWAAAGALTAVITGLQLAGVSRVSRAAATGHAGFGIAAGILITTLAILRYSAAAREQEGYRISWLFLEIGSGVLIIAAAITGHRL